MAPSPTRGRDAATAAGARSGARWGTALLLVGSLALALAVAEAGVRWLWPQPSWEAWRRASLRYTYHPVYHWRLAPGTYDTRHGRVHVNALGLRGEEIDPEPPPGRLRVLALGGSSTFNYQAPDDGTWPARLERFLARSLDAEVEVINAGVPGYSTYQSSMRLVTDLADLGPDLVLVYHLWNDLKLFWMSDPEAMVAKWDRHGRAQDASRLLEPSPVLDRLSDRSHLVTAARFAAVRWRFGAEADREGWIHTELDRTVSDAGLAFYRSNLQRILDAMAERGVPVVLIQQATLIRADAPPEARERIKYRFTGFDHDELVEAVERGRAVVRELARRPGASLVSTDAFPADVDHLRDHVHPTDAGLAALVRIIGPPVAALLRSGPPQRGDGPPSR